jgi:hypothetical protein
MEFKNHDPQWLEEQEQNYRRPPEGHPASQQSNSGQQETQNSKESPTPTTPSTGSSE